MASERPSEPEFRRGDVSDAQGILRVISAAFPEWPPVEIDVPPIDHLRWKMTPPEPLPRADHAIVELDGEIVAVQLRWPARAHVRGEDVPIEVGTDLAVHPDARGRGLSRLIRAHEQERIHPLRLAGFDTTPQNELVRRMQESDGLRILRPMAVWTRTFTAATFLRDHRAAGPLHLARAAGVHLARSVARRLARDRGSANRTIDRVVEFDARASDLWERVRRDYDLARRRDHRWLNWRYLDPRAGHIEAYAMTEGDRLLGYVVVRRNRVEGTVLDLVTDPAVPGVGGPLLDRGARALRDAGCGRVTCLLPVSHREEAALSAGGFLRTGEGRSLDFSRDRHQQLPEILEIAADPTTPIHVMLGEFDHA